MRYLDFGQWRLLSAVERNRMHPSFWIPSTEERMTVQPGELAQMLFEIDLYSESTGQLEAEVERMWVCVLSAGDGIYSGVLINQPCAFPEHDEIYLNYGAEIPFHAEHIMEINRAQPRNEMLALDIATQPSRRWVDFQTETTPS